MQETQNLDTEKGGRKSTFFVRLSNRNLSDLNFATTLSFYKHFESIIYQGESLRLLNEDGSACDAQARQALPASVVSHRHADAGRHVSQRNALLPSFDLPHQAPATTHCPNARTKSLHTITLRRTGRTSFVFAGTRIKLIAQRDGKIAHTIKM